MQLYKDIFASRSTIADDDRSVRPVLIPTKSTEQQVEELIWAGRRVTIDSIATFEKCAHFGSSDSWPRDTKNNRMGICFNLFGQQKQHLGDKQFADDAEVQHEDPYWG
ncbi:hypothetical protein TNIN_187421 [Trichonephila inaurata madagascariensis]|uniref:Uncharacterized protein n=1 Tax=Trichonephila inaurata madagascariensis TaxID=2747483 RepID=A0A8X6X3K4_9ARAC|nr:hypothetical protein TNIN_187421 [Trichonephila inaurata madagascariensis]